MKPPFAATTPAAATQRASGGSAPGTRYQPRSQSALSNLVKVVLSGARAEKSKSWLWPALAAVLGAVLAIAGAAIAMRQKPRYVAVALPEARAGTRAAAAGENRPSGPEPWPRRTIQPRQPQPRRRKVNRSRKAERAGQSGAGYKQPRAAGYGPSRDTDRLRQSTEPRGQSRIDRLVNNPTGARQTCDGRGEGRRRHSRSQDARNHDLEEEHGSHLAGDAHDRPEVFVR